jgi:hypothetical protein
MQVVFKEKLIKQSMEQDKAGHDRRGSSLHVIEQRMTTPINWMW